MYCSLFSWFEYYALDHLNLTNALDLTNLTHSNQSFSLYLNYFFITKKNYPNYKKYNP